MLFEPPDTVADPAKIGAAADTLGAVAGRITGRGTEVLAAVNTTAPAFSDLVASQIRAQGGYNEQLWRAAVTGVTYGSAVTRAWADDVTWFKSQRQVLVAEWDAAVADNFGVKTVDTTAMSLVAALAAAATYQAAVTAAKVGKLADLNSRAAVLWEEFQVKAGLRGQQLRTGPTDASVASLTSAGYLPSGFASWQVVDAARPDAVIDDLVTRGILPPECRDMSLVELDAYLVTHPEVADNLRMDNHPALFADSGSYVAGLSQLNPNDPDAMATNAAFFAGLTPEQAAWCAILFPSSVGNMIGAPFDARVQANRVLIAAEIWDEEQAILQRADERDDLVVLPGDPAARAIAIDQLDDADGASRDRIAAYWEFLAGNHQIVVFKPEEGAVAEMVGDLDAQTRYLGLYVPGAGTDIATFSDEVDRARTFVDADPNGELVMLVWLGGDMPGVPNGNDWTAADPSYSQDLAPKLVQFSREVDHEVTRVGAGDMVVTVMGHSYGGAIVGLADADGLVADRVLHIASAGMGHGVDSPDDVPADRSRYSLTSPDDPISLIQGAADGIAHGDDPDTFPGNVELATDDDLETNDRFGPDATDLDAHGLVFAPGSLSWNNIYGVLTSGTVTPVDTMTPTDIDTVEDAEPVTPPEETPTPEPPVEPEPVPTPLDPTPTSTPIAPIGTTGTEVTASLLLRSLR